MNSVKKNSRCVFCLLLIIFACSQVLGQNTAARPDRGITPNSSYSVSDIERVSLTNGNLNLSISLASLPPMAGGKLGWGIKAYYNSKLWNTHVKEVEDVQGNYLEETLEYQHPWQIGFRYHLWIQHRNADYEAIVPGAGNPEEDPVYDELKNYTTKFMLSTPDGAVHELRPMDASSGGAYHDFATGYYKQTPVNAPMRYYSFDGSYLWARIEPLSGGFPTAWSVYLPDGTIIEQQSNGIQYIKDTNGNKVKIWTEIAGSITTNYCQDDVTGRLIKYSYDSSTNTGQAQYQTVGGTWVSVDINWGTTQVTGHTYLDGSPCFLEQRAEATIPVIRSIVLPATEPGQPRRQFTFSYNSDTTDSVNILRKASCTSGGGYEQITAASHGWGALSQMVTPTGATVNYGYTLDGTYQLVVDPKDAPRESVTHKTITHDGTTETWTYGAGITGGGVTNPDGSFTNETMYQHDPALAYIYGGGIGLGGLVYRTNHSDKVIVERHWTRLECDGCFSGVPGSGYAPTNPVVDKEYTTLMEGGVAVKMAARTFQYDYNGNLISQTDYDWFDPASSGCTVSRDTQDVPTGVPGCANVLRVINNSYYNQATTANSSNVYAKRSLSTGAPLILNALQQTTIGPSIIQLSYDNQAYGVAPSAGNLTGKSAWNDVASNWTTTSNIYDTYGNVITTTDCRGKVTTYAYDATHALPTSVTVDPENGTGAQTATVAYDFSTGLVTSQTDINGQISTINYTNQLLGTVDPFGRPGIASAPLIGGQRHLVTTTYEDHLLRVTVASDLNTENDKLLKSRTTMDMLGRPVLTEQTEDGTNYTISVKNAYLDMGRVTLTSNPMRGTTAATDGWTRVTRDNVGRVVEVASFGGATQPAWSGTGGSHTGSVTTAYDGPYTTVTDQALKVRRRLTDALGRLRRVDEPDNNGQLGSTAQPNQPTCYEYDVAGNLTKVIQGGQLQSDPYQCALSGSQQRTFVYDSLSRLRTATNPESGQVLYNYDDNGNLVTKKDARGVWTHFEYDSINRVTRKWHNSSASSTVNGPLPTGVEATSEVEYSYDQGTNGRGRLFRTEKGGNWTERQNYDALGRPQLIRQAFPGVFGTNYADVEYEYTLTGAVKKITYPTDDGPTDPRYVEYLYDDAGRVGKVQGTLGDGQLRAYASGIDSQHPNIEYSAFGGITRQKFATQTPLYHKLSYNHRGQLETVRLSSASDNTGTDPSWDRGKLVNHYGTTDNNGNLRWQEHYIPGGSTYRTEFDYDSLNRLQWARETVGANQQWKQTFVYDRWGNRTIDQNTANTTTNINRKLYGIDTVKNQLTVPAGESGVIEYDAAGNLTKETYGGDERTPLIKYDAENMMTTRCPNLPLAACPDEAFISAYDGDGQRVWRYTSTAESHFVYGADGVLLFETADATENAYLNGQLLVVSKQASVWNGTQWVSQTTLRWLVKDQLGTPRIVADQTGASTGITRHDYLPFGEEITSSIGGRNTSGYGYSPDTVRQQFTSKERDVETGLDYFLARYYSSTQARFVSPDPFLGSGKLTNPQTWNRYSYTLNNPLRFIDPTGMVTDDPPDYMPEFRPCTVGVDQGCSADSTVLGAVTITYSTIAQVTQEQIELSTSITLRELQATIPIEQGSLYAGELSAEMQKRADPMAKVLTVAAVVATAEIAIPVALGAAAAGSGTASLGLGTTTATNVAVAEEIAVIGSLANTSSFSGVAGFNVLRVSAQAYTYAGANLPWLEGVVAAGQTVLIRGAIREGSVTQMEIAFLQAAGYVQAGQMLIPPH